MTNAIITREYKGNVFTFREDGYFNMKDAAKKFGKEVKHFWGLPSTVEYLEALRETVGKSDLYETRVGRNGGTWGHPKLAVFFARWLDVKFAVWCDMVIDDILNKKAELTGKRHDSVIRDIRNMMEQLGDSTDLWNVREDKDARGYTACFHLPKDLTITLVSGYNVKMRYAITKRWMELEAEVEQPTFRVPQSLPEALRLAAELAEQNEKLALAQRAAQGERIERYGVLKQP